MLSWQSILRIGCQTERLEQLRARLDFRHNQRYLVTKAVSNYNAAL